MHNPLKSNRLAKPSKYQGKVVPAAVSLTTTYGLILHWLPLAVFALRHAITLVMAWVCKIPKQTLLSLEKGVKGGGRASVTIIGQFGLNHDNSNVQVYQFRMLLKSYWEGFTGTEQERWFVMLWRKLIRKLLALLVNLVNFITLEESPDYIWKIADNPKNKLWLGVIGKLAEGALYPTVRVSNKDVEQHWSQYQPLRNTLVTGHQLDIEPLTTTI
ncbi:hypothetical protein llap_7255 [Limosa lapponica baueri]|uniref:Uncharacterized protein n=1 Tax=Limosa lapponica baueri TaxID=1758121 RepID=A0A2I0U8S4_LIMLA|nr:hypothetical protein llap_7255 [Limosa lapponica baueri]